MTARRLSNEARAALRAATRLVIRREGLRWGYSNGKLLPFPVDFSWRLKNNWAGICRGTSIGYSEFWALRLVEQKRLGWLARTVIHEVAHVHVRTLGASQGDRHPAHGVEFDATLRRMLKRHARAVLARLKQVSEWEARPKAPLSEEERKAKAREALEAALKKWARKHALAQTKVALYGRRLRRLEGHQKA